MRNTSQRLPPETADRALSEYMLKLKDSGYSQEFRTQIVLSAKQGFQSQLEKDRQGLRPLYKDRKRILADQKERGRGKVDWWNKPRGASNPKQSSQLFFWTSHPRSSPSKEVTGKGDYAKLSPRFKSN